MAPVTHCESCRQIPTNRDNFSKANIADNARKIIKQRKSDFNQCGGCKSERKVIDLQEKRERA